VVSSTVPSTAMRAPTMSVLASHTARKRVPSNAMSGSPAKAALGVRATTMPPGSSSTPSEARTRATVMSFEYVEVGNVCVSSHAIM